MKTKVNGFKKHSFAYVIGAFFIASILLHFVFSYYSYITNENRLEYTFTRDVFENWQSEMLQLFVQVVFLAYFLYVGSPQSREGHDRLEEKVTWLMTQINPLEAERINKELEKRFPKK